MDSPQKGPGPCITNVFATRRKNFSQWHRSFQRKLLSHWLKFLRHVAITLVIQGPVTRKMFPFDDINMVQHHPDFSAVLAFIGHDYSVPSAGHIQCGTMITVILSQNIHNRHPIAHLWGWGMGCLLWVQTLIDILLQSLQCCMQFILDSRNCKDYIYGKRQYGTML